MAGRLTGLSPTSCPRELLANYGNGSTNEAFGWRAPRRRPQLQRPGKPTWSGICLFNLRGAFVQTLQEKAILEPGQGKPCLLRPRARRKSRALQSRRNRAGRFGTPGIAAGPVLSDLQTAEVNLRIAKIQLLMLLNDQTPVEQFDVIGPFDFAEQLPALSDVRQAALDTRPDLKAAFQSDRQGEDRLQALPWPMGRLTRSSVSTSGAIRPSIRTLGSA